MSIPFSKVVGKALPRIDGVAKVTGTARYAADSPVRGLTHCVFVLSTIARGRIAGIDTRAAEAAPGVLAVLTHHTMPRLAAPDPELGFIAGFMPIQDDRVRYSGQPVALVVALTIEQAQHAAELVAVKYVAEKPRATLAEGMPDAYVPPPDPDEDEHNEVVRGDPAAGFAAAHKVVEATYVMPMQHHNPLEPSATVAEWSGDRLTVHDATQDIAAVRAALAGAFDLPPDNVRVLSPYLGGGFGAKGLCWPHPLLTAAAARHVGRPVKHVLTRAQTYTAHGHRPDTHQKLRIGADRTGRLTAIEHVMTQQVSRTLDFMPNEPTPTRTLYACPNVRSVQRAVQLDLASGSFARAPETVGNYGLESALDELAHALDLDPVELRIRNHSPINQDTGQPHGSNHLIECYRRGARSFGWHRRDPRPGSMRDRDGNLIGWGMASAGHGCGDSEGSRTEITLHRDATATVRSAAHDIGTGTYTVMTQLAAQTLGLPMSSVTFLLGDSRFPAAMAAVASGTVQSVGTSVVRAATQARDRAIAIAVAERRSPLHGLPPDRIGAADGYLFSTADPSRRISYETLMRYHGRAEVFVSAPEPPPNGYTTGAVFVEVRIDPSIGRLRVTKVVGVFDPGRVLNHQTARSQAVGGAIWGIGFALTEHTLVDPHLGRIMNPNLSGYLVPVNADVPDMKFEFIDLPDPTMPNLGARGLGEATSTGVAPAIGNAVHHATGRRIRELPITPEKLVSSHRT